MMITNSTINFYVDYIKCKAITKENLFTFILVREQCSYEDAKEIELDVLDMLEE